jgi:hypothetical protein
VSVPQLRSFQYRETPRTGEQAAPQRQAVTDRRDSNKKTPVLIAPPAKTKGDGCGPDVNGKDSWCPRW